MGTPARSGWEYPGIGYPQPGQDVGGGTLGWGTPWTGQDGGGGGVPRMGYPSGQAWGTPPCSIGQYMCRVLDTQRAVYLLRSRRRTFLLHFMKLKPHYFCNTI